MGLKLNNITLAIIMSILDGIMMVFVKKYYLGEFISKLFLIIPMLIYSVQPLLFYKALTFEGMGVFNILWDSISNLLVLFLGIFIFSEKLTILKYIGIGLSFVCIYLLSY